MRGFSGVILGKERGSILVNRLNTGVGTGVDCGGGTREMTVCGVSWA